MYLHTWTTSMGARHQCDSIARIWGISSSFCVLCFFFSDFLHSHAAQIQISCPYSQNPCRLDDYTHLLQLEVKSCMSCRESILSIVPDYHRTVPHIHGSERRLARIISEGPSRGLQ